MDRHGAERAVDVPRTIQTDHAVETAHAVITEGIGKEAEGLDRAAGDALESGTLIDILQIDGGILARKVHPVRNDRRHRTLDHRYRLEHGIPTEVLEQEQVVECVHQIGTPRVPRRRLAGC